MNLASLPISKGCVISLLTTFKLMRALFWVVRSPSTRYSNPLFPRYELPTSSMDSNLLWITNSLSIYPPLPLIIFLPEDSSWLLVFTDIMLFDLEIALNRWTNPSGWIPFDPTSTCTSEVLFFKHWTRFLHPSDPIAFFLSSSLLKLLFLLLRICETTFAHSGPRFISCRQSFLALTCFSIWSLNLTSWGWWYWIWRSVHLARKSLWTWVLGIPFMETEDTWLDLKSFSDNCTGQSETGYGPWLDYLLAPICLVSSCWLKLCNFW